MLFKLCDMKLFLFFFFFNDTATTEIYTLSLHDALPISAAIMVSGWLADRVGRRNTLGTMACLIGIFSFLAPWLLGSGTVRSEEHTSELQSRLHLVCRLLLEKKKKDQML